MAEFPTTLDTTPPSAPDAVKYYTNCRGVNYLPLLEEEWKMSGYLPRYSVAVAAGFYDVSNSFLGTNKTTQWVYYNSKDHENCMSILRSIGINSIRTFTNIYVWENNRNKFLNDLKDFMRICDKYKIRVQLVLWDGVVVGHIGGDARTGGIWSQPTDSAGLVSSMEFCMLATWPRIPFEFQQDYNTVDGLDFFTNSAIPFIDDIISSTSSYQSLWSIDVANELDEYTASALVSATGSYIMGKAPWLAITFGWGAGTNPFSGVLTNGKGTGPGGTYFYYSSLNPHLSLKDAFNLDTIHAYTTNAVTRSRYVGMAISSAYQTGNPAMSNESTISNYGSWGYNEISGFHDLRFGTIMFDGFIDRAYSTEPFLTTQGMFFYDGTTRDSRTTNMYSTVASSQGWIRPRQLNFNNTEKQISIDEGVDGGYWSGYVPEHRTFLPDIYISATQSRWEATKAYQYAYYSNPGQMLTRFNNRSQNYPPYRGHPMDFEGPGYDYQNDRLDFEGMIDILFNWSGEFGRLQDMTYALSGENFRNVDINLYRRDFLLNVLSMPDLPTFIIDQFNWLENELSGSQYDTSIIPHEIKSGFSAAYYPLYRTDGSSVKIAVGPNYGTSAYAPCVLASSCLYNTPGDPNSGIDWEAYDTLYDTCVDYLQQAYTVLLDAAETNDRYKLWP